MGNFRKLFLQKEVYKMFWGIYLLMITNIVVAITFGTSSNIIGAITTFAWCHIALVFVWKYLQTKKRK